MRASSRRMRSGSVVTGVAGGPIRIRTEDTGAAADMAGAAVIGAVIAVGVGATMADIGAAIAADIGAAIAAIGDNRGVRAGWRSTDEAGGRPLDLPPRFDHPPPTTRATTFAV